MAFSCLTRPCKLFRSSQLVHRHSKRPSGRRFCSSQQKTPPQLIIEEEDHANVDKIRKRRFFFDQSQVSGLAVESSASPEEQNHSRSIFNSIRNLSPLRAAASYFLPVGFPSSVRSPDYGGFYKWLFIQNVAGSTSYIMSMEALLHAVGVSSSALGWAAAASWVLKDGLGSVGMIFSAKILGDNNKFDADTLRAKWRADVAHNLGVSFELMTLLFPALFLPLASLANTLKGIAGLTNGACRASINRHLATQNNLGDVTAKGHAQGLAAYLTGLGLGVGLDSMIPAMNTLVGLVFPALELPRVAALWTAFSLLACVHVWCSYMALRSIALRSLNLERTSILLDDLFAPHLANLHAIVNGASPSSPFEIKAFPSPLQLRDSKREPIISRSEFLHRTPAIKLGVSVSDAFPTASSLTEALEIFGDQKFLLSCHSNSVFVVFHASASPLDIFKAFFFAFCVQMLQVSSLKTPLNSTQMFKLKAALTPVLCQAVEQLSLAGWNMDEILLVPNKLRFKANWTSNSQV